MSGAMEAHLAECVQDALANFLHRNATFLAERLFASFPNEVWSASSSALLPADRPAAQANAHLLGTCHLRCKQPHRAYAVLKGAKHHASRDVARTHVSVAPQGCTRTSAATCSQLPASRWGCFPRLSRRSRAVLGTRCAGA